MPKGLRPITTMRIFNGADIAGSGVVTSVAIDLTQIAQNGVFSLEWTLTGTGVLTLSYTVCSIKAGTYFTPAGAGSIVTGLQTVHGGMSIPLPPMYPFLKIVATETGGAAHAGLTLDLNVQ